MKRVAIIGAGISGLSALDTFKKAGYEVCVFEKGRGSGGRLASKRIGIVSWDMGVQFIRAYSPEFQAVLETWHEKNWVQPWDVPVSTIDASSIRPSNDKAKRYVGVPKMTALSRKYLEQADDFITSTRIVTTEYHDQQWMLTDELGETFGPFDALVVSTPPEQAKALLPSDFEAKLNVEMNPCWTLLLSFEQPLPTDVNAAFVDDFDISWVARNNSKPERDNLECCWTIHATYPWSKKHVNADKSWVTQYMMEQFFKALHIKPQKPVNQWLHRWLYASPATPKPQGQTPYLADKGQHVAVCGDWLSDTVSFEGAYFSGSKAAQALIDGFEQGTSPANAQ